MADHAVGGHHREGRPIRAASPAVDETESPVLVLDAMTPDPITVDPTCPVKGALGLLLRHRITALPVVDGAGALVGVVSETDLIRTSVPPDPRAHLRVPAHDRVTPRTVADVLTPAPVTVRAYDDVATAVGLMAGVHARSLPVLDASGALVGIVSRSDVARLLARPDGAIRAEITEVLRAAGRPDWRVSVDGGIVLVEGPRDDGERSLATSVAHTVPGVMEVRTA